MSHAYKKAVWNKIDIKPNRSQKLIMTYLQLYLQTKAAKDKSVGTLQESRSNIRQFLALISGGISENFG